jgi:hypothetical protein
MGEHFTHRPGRVIGQMQRAADDGARITRTREPRFPRKAGREFGVALDDRDSSYASVSATHSETLAVVA